MIWVLSSILTAVCGSLIWLTSKILEFKYHSYFILVLVSSLLPIISLLYCFFRKEKLQLNIFSIISGILYTFVPFFVIKGLKYVNNPGKFLSVFRTQIILTFILGVIIFKYTINPLKLFSMLVTLGGVFMVVFLEDKNKNEKKCKDKDNKLWIIYAIGAIVAYSLYDIFVKKATTQISITNQITQSSTLTCICSLIIFFILQKKFKISKDDINPDKYITNYDKYIIPSIIINVICGAFFIILLNYSISIAPKPSYVKAILIFSLVITTSVSNIILKKSNINLKQWMGILVLISGILGLIFLK